jgi:hypothetical protein
MSLRFRCSCGLASFLGLAMLGCDRNVEPFVPGEEPREPDLTAIFPAGAQQAAESPQPVELPPAPEQGRRGLDPFADAPPIRGVVRLPDQLSDRTRPGAVLFIIARSRPTGPPLAVKRVAQPRFPLEFEVGPGDRMIRTLPFAGAFQLSARLDADGNATSRSPGDLEGRADGSFGPGASGVEILLDEPL